MIIGNTVHFIHLAYPTDIVTDIRNYNHFNPKELNPILKLAICEDNPSHYEIIHTILQKYPPGAFEITHFTSGDEFLRAAAENGCPYSIVLTDIDLGSDAVNGISLARKDQPYQPGHSDYFYSASICNMLPQYMRQNMPTLSINNRWKISPSGSKSSVPEASEIAYTISVFLRKFTQLSGALLRYSLSGTKSEADHDLYQNRNIYNKRKTDSSYRKNETRFLSLP